MRKPTVIVSSLLLLTVCIQHESLAQILVGPKAGLNWGICSVANQSSDVTNSYLLGIALGMVAETRIGETFSIQAEPCLVQKGSEINFAPSYTRLRLYYVQVPFTIKARLVHGLVIPYVFIGPNVGLLLTAKAETNVYGGSQEFDVKQNYSKSDVALDLGAGFEYEISTSAVLTLDIRYSLGLSNIDRTNTESVRTRSIQLLVGTVFRI